MTRPGKLVRADREVFPRKSGSRTIVALQGLGYRLF
jgi:hypothetical protein